MLWGRPVLSCRKPYLSIKSSILQAAQILTYLLADWLSICSSLYPSFFQSPASFLWVFSWAVLMLCLYLHIFSVSFEADTLGATCTMGGSRRWIFSMHSLSRPNSGNMHTRNGTSRPEALHGTAIYVGLIPNGF